MTRSAVLPVYDEPVDRWAPLVERLRESGWDEVVLSVDAPDGPTRAALARLGDRDGVRLSVSAERRGKGRALADGLAVASGDVLGYVDADGAVPVAELEAVYGAVERGEAALAVGSRDRGAGRDGQSRIRRALGTAYGWLARRLAGVPVRDVQCGAKAFTAALWRTVVGDVETDGFGFDTELVALASERGFDVAEVPIDWRDPGDSDVRVGRAVPRMLSTLWRLRRRTGGSTDGDGAGATAARGPLAPDGGGTVATSEAPASTAAGVAAGSDRTATDDDPVSVALVSSHPPNRGHLAEYGAELAAAYAARDDVAPTVFARRTADAPPVERRDGYAVHRVWERDSLAAARRLLSALRAGDFDVVQFNVHMTYFGTDNAHRFAGLVLPPLVRALTDATVVTTLHDLLEVVEDDHVAETVGPVERVGARVATQLALLGDATTVTAADYRETVAERYYAPAVHHVPHGTFARTDGGIDVDGPPRLLVFGFLGPTKDVETTVAAFRRLRERYPDAELVVAGGAHPDYPGYQAALADRFGDEPGVRFTGYVEDDELADVWHGATTLVMPYRTCTGVSGVFQLAKAYGTPVVAYDTDGMRTSTVETGGDAVFVPPEDPAALAGTVGDLWAAPERLRSLARANAAAADTTSMDDTAARMVSVFADALDPATAASLESHDDAPGATPGRDADDDHKPTHS